MDIFAHGLWSYAVFHRKRYALLAVFFGLLPDFLSFGILYIINLVNGNFRRGPPPIDSIPEWLFAAYNMTHSLVIFLAIFMLLYLFTKKWLWAMAAWGIHIITDIPTHSARYFPTPFLWPISDFGFDGIRWGTPWFMALNYGSIFAVYLLIARNKAKERKALKNGKEHFGHGLGQANGGVQSKKRKDKRKAQPI